MNTQAKSYCSAIFTVSGLLLSFLTYAQKDFMLYGMNNMAQSHIVNPAFMPNSKGYITFPVMNTHMGISHSGFQLNHLLQTRPQDDSLVLTPDFTLSKMAALNYVNMDMNNEIMGFGFKANKSYFHFNVTHKFAMRFMYPKDLFVLGIKGNGSAELLGQRASMDGFGIDVMDYIEFGAGYNREFNDKLTIGGKLKYISGVANVYTRHSALGIHTDETTFDITIDGQMTVNSSNVKPFFDTVNGPNARDFIFNSNRGFGIDLGGSYKLTDKITLQASVVDLGMISWKTNVATLASNDVNFTFQGVDIEQLAGDTTGAVMQAFADSLGGIFNASENNDAYTTPLHTRLYIGGTFKLNEKLEFGGLWYSEFIHSRYRTAITASANAQVTKWLRVGLNYTAYARDYFNVGLGFAINGGPIQYYFLTDNVIGMIAPHATKNWQVRTGINFLIGRDKKEKESKSSL
jgi:hypothetical protein